MTAMNGSTVSSHGRGRLLGLCIGLALTLCAVVLAPASASAKEFKPVAETTTTYLSLGDSIGFGYTAEKFNLHKPNDAPSFFEEGFSDFFTKDLAKSKEIGPSVRLVNDACPGETSNGLIGENPELGGEKSTEPAGHNPQGLGDWHPCAYTNVDGLPLHNELRVGGEAISQLEDAVSILTTPNPFTGEPNKVGAITLQIGSNDELAQITQCEIEVTEEFEKTGKSKYGGSSPETAILLCITKTASTITVPHILKNLGDILGVLDHFYHGPIVLLGFYNPDAFVLPGSDPLQQATNEAVEKEILPHFPNVTFANPFPVFNRKKSSTTAAQEQENICKFTEMCNPNVQSGPGTEESSPLFGKDGDIHPSLAGYKELAKLINKAYLANPAR
jgi:lysophospholipase L1-like esterase